MKFKLFIKLLCINCILIRINAFPVQDEEQDAVWSDVAPINFEEKKQGDVNVDIRFEIRYHGDGFAFDGPRSVRARASSLAKNSGINKIQVPAHESENSLGLSYSKENQALMAPTYLVYQPTFVLHVDDIKSIAAVHGTKDQVTQEPAGPPRDAPDLCQDPSIDTITRTESGDTYVFKGDFYWKIYNGIADGYPKRIDDDWVGLEGNLDASITFHGKTYFFKGIHYWSFTNKIMDKGYPQLISQGFRGLPSDLDAACVWSGNGEMYFFKGDHYWKYNDNENPPVNRGYPAPIYKWRGLPNNLDAAVLWDNNINYFFKGDQYYRFDNTRDAVDPQYPLPTAKYLFGCDGNTRNRSIKK